VPGAGGGAAGLPRPGPWGAAGASVGTQPGRGTWSRYSSHTGDGLGKPGSAWRDGRSGCGPPAEPPEMPQGRILTQAGNQVIVVHHHLLVELPLPRRQLDPLLGGEVDGDVLERHRALRNGAGAEGTPAASSSVPSLDPAGSVAGGGLQPRYPLLPGHAWSCGRWQSPECPRPGAEGTCGHQCGCWGCGDPRPGAAETPRMGLW